MKLILKLLSKIIFIAFIICCLIYSTPKNTQAIVLLQECKNPCPAAGKEYWCGTCTGQRQGCEADAAVANVYWCEKDGGDWKPQNPECTVSCYGETKPTTGESNCTGITVSGFTDKNGIENLGNIFDSSKRIRISLDVREEDKNSPMKIFVDNKEISGLKKEGRRITQDVTEKSAFAVKEHAVTLKKDGNTYCEFTYQVAQMPSSTDPTQNRTQGFANCKLQIESEEIDSKKFTSSTHLTIIGEDLPWELNYGRLDNRVEYVIKIDFPNGETHSYKKDGEENLGTGWAYFFLDEPKSEQGNMSSFSVPLKGLFPDSKGDKYLVSLLSQEENYLVDKLLFGWTWKNPVPYCGSTSFIIDDSNGGISIPSTPPASPYVPSLENLCDDNVNKTRCLECIRKSGAVWTALGCIKTDISGFVSSFFKIGLGIGGGIAFLFLIFGGFTVMTSAGNPEKIQQGKDIITSAISGLLLIIFSVLLLQLISVDILKIPGFSKQPAVTSTSICPSSKPIVCNADPSNPICCASTEKCVTIPTEHCEPK